MRDQSPPRTPPNADGRRIRQASVRQLHSHHAGPDETFFHDHASPVQRHHHHQLQHHQHHHHRSDNMDSSPRDSHDLAMDHHTRDSVVDNMLLSLDQISSTGLGAFSNPVPPYASLDDDDGDDDENDNDNEEYYTHDTHYAPHPHPPPPQRPPRARGHTYSSSNPSDYDPNPTTTAHHHIFTYPDYHQHTRQSNSTSKFNTTRTTTTDTHSVWAAQEQQQQQQRRSHSRGPRQGSKSSASSSMDYGQRLPLTAPRPRRVHRSASLDINCGPLQQQQHQQQHVLHDPHADLSGVMGRGRPVPVTYHSFEAAPSPTVYSGPQRFGDTPLGSPAFPPQPICAPPQIPSSRRNSIRSATSRSRKPSRSAYPDAAVMAQANEFYRAAARDGAHDPIAPGPNVMSHHLKHGTDAAAAAAAAVSQSSPKEKPGFFRRVFGGSSRKENNQPAAAPPPHTAGQSVESKRVDDRPKTMQHGPPSAAAARNMPATVGRPASKTLSKPPPPSSSSVINHSSSSADQTSNHHQQPQVSAPPPPTLNKKHSSFFRRRKKSVVETLPPTLVPLQLQAIRNANVDRPQDSPGASSLYKAIDPFLHDDDNAARINSVSAPRQHSGNSKPADDDDDDNTPPMPQHDARRVREGQGVDYSWRGGTEQYYSDDPPPPSRGRLAKNFDNTMNSDGPKLKLKVKRGKVIPASEQDTTFLADSSGAEDREPTGKPATTTLSTLGPKSPTHPASSSSSSSTTPLRSPAAAAAADVPTPKANSAEKRAKQNEFRKLQQIDTNVGSAGASTSRQQQQQSSRAIAANRLWLEPTSSDEKLDQDALLRSPTTTTTTMYEDARSSQPASAAAGHRSPCSATDEFYSTTSLPIVQVNSTEAAAAAAAAAAGRPNHITDHDNDEHDDHDPHDDHEPTEEDRDRAAKIFGGDEEFTSKFKAAAWLGEASKKASRTRKAYMELYEWSGQSIVSALRDMCTKLLLKAETQQVDRVLASFALRWWDCNPNNGFKSTDLVHAITYSILLLNTDLHMADIEQKMTRAQFVKNTMPTMRRLAEEATAGQQRQQQQEDEADELAATIKAMNPHRKAGEEQRGFVPWVQCPEPPPIRPRSGRTTPSEDNNNNNNNNNNDRPSLESKRSRNRLSIRPPAFRTDSDDAPAANAHADNCTVLVKAPYEGPLKGWETQVEIVLKEFYNSIRNHCLPLYGAEQEQSAYTTATKSLAVGSHLRRTPSVLSKANSEHLSYSGRSVDFRTSHARYNSKNRSRPHLYPNSTVGSSRTSLDDQSVWSPAQSSTWSKYSLGKTQASMMSVDSLGSHFAAADYQQSIGFANALSQAIIREEGIPNSLSSEEFTKVAPLLEDESLELAGAPWAKEGILKHKHLMDAPDKKAKDRGWSECFAVIEKGYMRLFSFGMNSKSLRHKNKSKLSGGGGGVVVGGGNWAENAENMGSFLLRQTIANALPPPGYSKTRPNVWALSLPGGAVHLFQVGTVDIVREFVSTANYWSARLSKEPLTGGVSNIEYGWGENVINSALIRPESSAAAATNHHHNSVSLPRASTQSSIRSSLDYQGNVRARLPGDKVHISEWKPPVSSMMASTLLAVDQLRALQAYVRNIESELARHNDLRPPMLIAFSPRHPNAGKALANWEKKSSYLLKEIVKFRTYIEALQSAERAKLKIAREKDAERAKAQEHDPLSAMSVEVDDGGIDPAIGRYIS